jgi:hypothetical protein
MKTRIARSSALAAVLSLNLIFCGCTEYWWTRGQPPSVENLISRSRAKLLEARGSRADARRNVSRISQDLEKSLLAAVLVIQREDPEGSSPQAELLESLESAANAFIALEGTVSIGSRAALGELSGQMRSFATLASQGKPLAFPAFGLFTARTLFFLANELSVPAPSFG